MRCNNRVLSEIHMANTYCSRANENIPNKSVLQPLPPSFQLKSLSKLTTTATRTPPNKRSMNKTMAVHVCHKALYISMPSSTHRQREMIKFHLFYMIQTTRTVSNFPARLVSSRLRKCESERVSERRSLRTTRRTTLIV